MCSIYCPVLAYRPIDTQDSNGLEFTITDCNPGSNQFQNFPLGGRSELMVNHNAIQNSKSYELKSAMHSLAQLPPVLPAIGEIMCKDDAIVNKRMITSRARPMQAFGRASFSPAEFFRAAYMVQRNLRAFSIVLSSSLCWKMLPMLPLAPGKARSRSTKRDVVNCLFDASG